ncbi:3'-5' exonuclease [Methyloversatilis thermotolerans]|uniref:3'-5' exonuclease n=1 Tax=Methyloversatilis thermotolerans TaxID=1346290 RepID=UPI00058B97AC|nr:exonuclease domain-containing protein [Methyloversatilis thermotolerans]
MSRSRRPDRRFWFALAALIGLLLAWGTLSAALLLSTLDAAQRAQLSTLFEGRWPLPLVALLCVLLPAAYGLMLLYRRLIGDFACLADEAGILLDTDTERMLPERGSDELRALVRRINGFVRQRRDLRADIAARIEASSRSLERERSRLAALMSELSQAIVVCNMDGRILLYNNRARLQFRTLSDTPLLADGAELLGLGRSIYAVFDRQLVVHALDSLAHRLQRGAASPLAQFVTTTRSGQLLRVQVAPVREADEGACTDSALGGFVLMLDNITRAFEDETARDRMLLTLTDGSRGSLASMQMAIDMLDCPDLDEPTRMRFQTVIRDEVGAMTARVKELAEYAARGMKTRWPLEDMLGSDLVNAAVRRIGALPGMRVLADEVAAEVWLRVDSYSLLQALAYLAARLNDEYDIRALQIRLEASPQDDRAHLDLIWQGQTMSTETIMGWQMDAMNAGDERSTLSVREVVERHGGEFWLERERVRHRAFFRFRLPRLKACDVTDSETCMRAEGRPEFYDFDLFALSESGRALVDRPLSELAYTVFDTETTGLDPSAGDEIIQIGAVRILNRRLLRQESFEQLIDPGRPIPAASIPIHGITQDRVSGQPAIDAVLPAFHAYARDTVLVAHNAAFDMRFLQLKEARTGVCFDQPVLDTLLLSALVHPGLPSHRLDAIAERFGVVITARHTALGDALVTAEVLLKLLPLLAGMGIHTLGEAMDASQKTYFARLKY